VGSPRAAATRAIGWRAARQPCGQIPPQCSFWPRSRGCTPLARPATKTFPQTSARQQRCWQRPRQLFRGTEHSEPPSRLPHTNRQRKLTLGFVEQSSGAGTRGVVQEKAQHLSITIDVHSDDVGSFYHRGSSHEETEASATEVPESGASPQTTGRMIGATADYESVIRSRGNSKANMSDTRHELTWINATHRPPPPNSAVFWPTGSEKADVMAALNRTTKFVPLRTFGANPPRLGASYAASATEMQLRQALAKAEALLLEKDLQIRTMLAWRESAVNHLAGLTRRQRQIMELVLTGQPSKNIAADLGISQRTVENHRAAIMKRTGSTSLPALARLALAAGWDGAAALPSTAGWRSTGGTDSAPTDQATADWSRQSATELATPGRDAANRSRSDGDRVIVFPSSPMPNTRQCASVTSFPAPVRCRSK